MLHVTVVSVVLPLSCPMSGSVCIVHVMVSLSESAISALTWVVVVIGLDPFPGLGFVIVGVLSVVNV